MESSTAKLEVRDLVVTYPLARAVVTAIDHVSLSIPAGQICAIVGPSGCGKSTLLRSISGLVKPAAGTIAIAHETSDKPLQAMVFQGRSVFPWMTVLENAAYGLAMRGVDRQSRESTAERLLRQVGLGEFVRAFPSQLSEGMRQRVAIVRAFAVDPELLLMDEPFGALDEQTRLTLQGELLRIWEATGKTVVFVTHSIDEAMTLADRIIVLSPRPGTIKADITVPFARPRTIEAVRSAPDFASLFLRIWSLLRDETLSPAPAVTA